MNNENKSSSRLVGAARAVLFCVVCLVLPVAAGVSCSGRRPPAPPAPPVAPALYAAKPRPDQLASHRILVMRVGPELGARYASLIRRFASEFELGPIEHYLAYQILWESNGGDSLAVGPPTKYGRAQGLGQILLHFWEDQCGTDMFNPEENLHCHARVMRWALDKCGGNLRCALAEYSGFASQYAERIITRAEEDI